MKQEAEGNREEVPPRSRRGTRQRAVSPGPLASEVAKLRSLPSSTEMVTAGFPCQDVSQAARMVGTHGERFGLSKVDDLQLRTSPRRFMTRSSTRLGRRCGLRRE